MKVIDGVRLCIDFINQGIKASIENHNPFCMLVKKNLLEDIYKN